MVKGKTVEEIRAIFGIVNDFSPQEEVGMPLVYGVCCVDQIMLKRSRRRTLGRRM